MPRYSRRLARSGAMSTRLVPSINAPDAKPSNTIGMYLACVGSSHLPPPKPRKSMKALMLVTDAARAHGEEAVFCNFTSRITYTRSTNSSRW